jgi:ADP-ribosylglycohydrolase
MAPGENTLEALLLRRSVAVIGESDGLFDPDAIRNDYINFMTTAGSHNDTYCGTAHRMFFSNYASGILPESCPDNDQHNVDTADSIVGTVAVALTSTDDQMALEQVKQTVAITRASRQSEEYAALFARLLRAVVRGHGLRQVLAEPAELFGIQVQHLEGKPDLVTA